MAAAPMERLAAVSATSAVVMAVLGDMAAAAGPLTGTAAVTKADTADRAGMELTIPATEIGADGTKLFQIIFFCYFLKTGKNSNKLSFFLFNLKIQFSF